MATTQRSGRGRRALVAVSLAGALLLSGVLPAGASGSRMSVKETGNPSRELAEATWSAGAVRTRSGRSERTFTVTGTDRRSDDGGVVCLELQREDRGRWVREARKCAKRDSRPVSVSEKVKWQGSSCTVRIIATVERGRVEIGREQRSFPCS